MFNSITMHKKRQKKILDLIYTAFVLLEKQVVFRITSIERKLFCFRIDKLNYTFDESHHSTTVATATVLKVFFCFLSHVLHILFRPSVCYAPGPNSQVFLNDTLNRYLRFLQQTGP